MSFEYEPKRKISSIVEWNYYFQYLDCWVSTNAEFIYNHYWMVLVQKYVSSVNQDLIEID